MSEWDLRSVLRMQAWERAKGELNSVLRTYYNGESYLRAVQKKIREFIKDLEDNELG